MKKILAFVLAAALVLTLAGCNLTGAGVAQPQTVTLAASPDSVSVNDYDDTLEGLCKYLAALGYAYDFGTGDKATTDEKGKDGDPICMDAGLIGADRGYKFTYKNDDVTYVLEVYSYSDRDNKYYKQIKADGEVTVSDEVENGTVKATLSDNGKYVMIFSGSGDIADRKAAVEKAFKAFYA